MSQSKYQCAAVLISSCVLSAGLLFPSTSSAQNSSAPLIIEVDDVERVQINEIFNLPPKMSEWSPQEPRSNSQPSNPSLSGPAANSEHTLEHTAQPDSENNSDNSRPVQSRPIAPRPDYLFLAQDESTDVHAGEFKFNSQKNELFFTIQIIIAREGGKYPVNTEAIIAVRADCNRDRAAHYLYEIKYPGEKRQVLTSSNQVQRNLLAKPWGAWPRELGGEVAIREICDRFGD